ncbi:hypothetical protein BD779DRAFT_1514739 [Infundibulicybe gibba]|nr:hypothetical protein BD779DRAFT_1514739 [Infundibulicybe gibba]
MMPPRALTFFGLNAVRALSIISLILVFSSSILVMVTNIKAVNAFEAHKGNSTESFDDCDYIDGSTVPNQAAGVFWAIVSSLLILFQSIILILSEVGWPLSFFDRYFPVLGSGFGLGALGIFQCLISTQILSHHVDDFTLVSAFLLFSIGCLNMLLGLIFRESAKRKRSITAWRAEAQGILPTTTDNRPVFVNASPSFVSGVFAGEKGQGASAKEEEAYSYRTYSWKSSASSTHSAERPFYGSEKAGYGFGRQGEKVAGLRGFILQKPEESLPRYATPPPAKSTTVSRSNSTATRSSSSSFSSPYRESTVSSSAPEEHRAGTPVPVFKSSPTAI